MNRKIEFSRTHTISRRFIIAIAIFVSSVELFSPVAFGLPFEGHHIVMSVANRYAAEVGQKIAEEGGNVIDCAVAMELVMFVTNPTFGALGGGGFALVSMNGQIRALDFRETAPAAMSADYYLKKAQDASITGGASVGVPGTLEGLWVLHKKYGHLPWRRLFDRAVDLARHGFRVTGKVVAAEKNNQKRFNEKARELFLKDGKPYRPGDKIVQEGLSRALISIRDHGPSPFYSGAIAKDIVDSVRASGGDMTLQDLEKYRVVWRKPLVTKYHDYQVYVMPLPSSGGLITIRALHLLDLSGIDKSPLLSVDEYHLMGAVLQRAFMDRTDMGDPDFNNFDTATLVGADSKGMAELTKLARSIRMKRATSSKDLASLMGVPFQPSKPSAHEAKETSHLSVLDENGNAVSMTFTLNGLFGSGIATKKYGIMLNDEMDDFTTHPGKSNMFGLVQGRGNDVGPGKRPLSSMSPTLVAKNGRVVMALGAPGGPRIISSVIQVLYRVLARRQDLERAVESPRVHHQFLPDILYYDDDGRMPYEIVKGLKARWHDVKPGWQAHVFAVYGHNGILEGVVDTRDEGLASGF